VILGGYSSERHISVESGRNIYEKLASSDKYSPIPVFLTGNNEQHQLNRIPINLLLKDNADDIRDKIEHFGFHPVIEKIKSSAAESPNGFLQSIIFLSRRKFLTKNWQKKYRQFSLRFTGDREKTERCRNNWKNLVCLTTVQGFLPHKLLSTNTKRINCY
jgi:D-alanine-D-alanine ligase-like ATP-grasp enzyme